MKRGKKILSVLLAVLLLAGCLPLSVGAAADPFSLRQELYFKGTHIATINLPQNWEGRVVTKKDSSNIIFYSRLCHEKQEKMGKSYCGDGKLFSISIVSGDDWKNWPSKEWIESFWIDGIRYEIVLSWPTDDRFSSTDPAIQEEAQFFASGGRERKWAREVIDNIVFHVETGGDTDDDDLTFPYELRTDTGELILTMQLPESWGNMQLYTENNSFSNYYLYKWTFCDSERAELFSISLNNFGWDGEDIHVIGTVILNPEQPPCDLLSFESYHPYDDSDNSEKAVAYRKMKSDIPAILHSIELNPDLYWTTFSSYWLQTDTGDYCLSVHLPKSWEEQGVRVETSDNSMRFLFGETPLCDLFISSPIAGDWVGFPFLYRDIIGTITTADGRKGRIWFVCPNSKYPSFYPENTDFDSSVYQELRNDIPAILRSIEPNPELDLDWLLSDSGFTDVPQSAYYCDAVKWAVEKDITSGTAMTRFSPNQSCTRAQAVTFLWRAAGSPEPASAANPFTDVKSGDYFYQAVLWAVEKGVTSGTSATKFSPNGKCTRAQIVTFQHRAAGSPAAGASGAFSDVTPDAYYAGAVAWAVENNITSGTSATKFSPNGKCTRAQIVTFLYRGSGT